MATMDESRLVTVSAGSAVPVSSSSSLLEHVYTFDVLFIVLIAVGYLIVRTALQGNKSTVTPISNRSSVHAKSMVDDTSTTEGSSDESCAKTNRTLNFSRPAGRAARPRRGNRQGSGPSECHRRLNNAVIMAESAESILELVQSSGEQMNEVNLATAIHRVARWCRKSPTAPYEVVCRPEWTKLLDLVQAGITKYQSQGLSNVLWALATMRVDPDQHKELIDELLEVVELKVTEFTQQALAHTAWAIATLGREGALMVAIRKQAEPGITSSAPADLANLIWALCASKVADDSLCATVCNVVMSRPAEFKAKELADVALAFSIAGYTNSSFWTLVKDSILAEGETYTSGVLATLALALAQANQAEQRVVSVIVRVAMIKMKWFSATEIVRLVEACAILKLQNARLVAGCVAKACAAGSGLTPLEAKQLDSACKVLGMEHAALAAWNK
mmetsp:Transcript_36837/g.88633  ORF Transcript_36837/g.88633 Transcript_36837/m.88633 type:complete len:446 (+) Transcript_36837:199-1536(+)